MGLIDWPSGTLRLEGIEVTTDPKEADIFVCPGNIRLFEYPKDSGILDINKLNKLPYFKGNESRNAFFDVSDNFKQAINLPIIFFRCDVRPWMLPHDPNTIQMAWPVEDYEECMDVPEGGFKYDVSFHGWVTSHETRKLSTDACRANTSLKSDLATYTNFCGHLHDRETGAWTTEGSRRRWEFRRSMKESRIALCPESISGVFPYRFFEAMSAGRVALLVGSDFVWPFASEIPYEEFSVICPREDAGRADVYVRTILDEYDDKALVEMGKMARHYWEAKLDSRRWPELMAYAVMNQLKLQTASSG